MRVPPGARPLRSWDPGHVVTARMRRRPSPGGHLQAGARDCSCSSGGPGESGGRGPGRAALGGRAPFRSRSGVGRHAVPRHTGLGGRPSCAHQPRCAPVTPPGRTVWPARSWPPQLGAAALGGGAPPRVRRTQGDLPQRPPAPRWPVFSPQKRWAEPWAPDGPSSRAGARWPRGWAGQGAAGGPREAESLTTRGAWHPELLPRAAEGTAEGDRSGPAPGDERFRPRESRHLFLCAECISARAVESLR